MMRRFRGFLRRLQKRPHTTLTRVLTDMGDCVYLHAGDSLHIERAKVVGFCVFAAVLRGGQLQTWPLYHCAHLREAEQLRYALDAALTRGARRFDARAQLQRQREANLLVHQEVAF